MCDGRKSQVFDREAAPRVFPGFPCLVRCPCACAACAVSVVHASHTRTLSCGAVWLTLVLVTGDSVRSRCYALRVTSRGRLPTLRDSVTPLPAAILCRPTTDVWQGDSRALALLTLPGEKKLLWAAVSCESLLRPTRHSRGALRGVHRGTPDSGCPWHLCAQPAYTHLALRSMSEWLTARLGRSAWETALPLGQHTS